MIRILIKALSPVAQAGLEVLLRAHPSFQIVENAPEVESEDPADVVLAEIESAEDQLERDIIEQASMGSPVILLAHQATPEWIGEMLRAGVHAVLPANATGAEIIASIEAAFAGLIVLHPAHLNVLVPSSNPLSNSAGALSVAEPLTTRETEVLQFLALGLANKEIAGRLQISEHTVKFHVASIMGKLGASSRTEAVTRGIRQGLVMI